MNFAMGKDAILRGQSGSLDDDEESIEEEEIHFDIDESSTETDIEDQLKSTTQTRVQSRQQTAT